MTEHNRHTKLELMDIQIGVTIVACLLICHIGNLFGLQIEALSVTTGAIMCVQDSTKSAYDTSMIRMLGVLNGGLCGVIIMLIDNAIRIPLVFYLLCGVGVVANLLLCKLHNMIYVQARVSCLTLILVVLANEGADRLDYALNRFIGSLVGAVIALLITLIFADFYKKIRERKQEKENK